MLFIHENNINGKINSNYKGKKDELDEFKKTHYQPFKEKILRLDFSKPDLDTFELAASLLNSYYQELDRFIVDNGITAQSKMESSFFEEISAYLFKDIPEIKKGSLSIFNKGVFAGLKMNQDLTLSIIKKDVDFCIGKKVNIIIEKQDPITLIIPIVSVEVKTYLDATMFREVRLSSKSLKSATPQSKAYLLMGYKDLADEHIIAARQDSSLDEIFVLKKNEAKPIDARALFLYWEEIKNAIARVTKEQRIKVPGRLLMFNDLLESLDENE